MASFEDMVVVGGSKRRKQLTAFKNCHRKYSNFLIHKDHEISVVSMQIYFFLPTVNFLWVTCERLQFIS